MNFTYLMSPTFQPKNKCTPTNNFLLDSLTVLQFWPRLQQETKERKIIDIYYERRSKPEPSRGCLSCISSHVPGFRDRKEAQNLSNRSQKQQHSNRRKNSVESQHSVGSGQGPPHGTRVVLGRETSPSPATCQPGITESVKPRLPAEIMD